MKRILVLALIALTSGCHLTRRLEMPSLATAQVSSDFHTYELHRVGLMPFQGQDLSEEQAFDLQAAAYSEFSRSTPFEVVSLDEYDLEEVRSSEPYRRGSYQPSTIIAVADRYRVDAILFGTVTQSRFYPPQILSLQIDLVAAETGVVIWSSAVHLDANDKRVLEGLEIYYGRKKAGDESAPSWEVSLLSPERFARFGAFQIACLL